ncbi:MAG: RsiV family protein [Bacillota bacterium]|nr:RsiV family protein [Bacillota bacterium]
MDYAGLGTVVYPQVAGLKSRVQNRINTQLRRRICLLLRRQGQGQPNICLWGSNETQLNNNGVLSLTEDVYSYRQNAAHGLTMRTAATFDVVTGQVCGLSELFKTGADYITPISQEIRRQIDEQDIPLLREFTHIGPNQEYFLTETNLVIYFQTYDYTPYYVGIPKFPIAIESLRDLIDTRSLLHRLLPAKPLYLD